MQEIVVNIQQGEIQNKRIVKAAFLLPDGRYKVRIEPFKKRTLPVNRYYWGVLIPLVREGLYNMGYSDVKELEQAHEILKHLFLKSQYTNESNGDVIPVAKSTTSLSTVEFNAYLEEIWQWAAEYLNVQIPQPNEQLTIFTADEVNGQSVIIAEQG